jgi:hypothetical protein
MTVDQEIHSGEQERPADSHTIHISKADRLRIAKAVRPYRRAPVQVFCREGFADFGDLEEYQASVADDLKRVLPESVLATIAEVAAKKKTVVMISGLPLEEVTSSSRIDFAGSEKNSYCPVLLGMGCLLNKRSVDGKIFKKVDDSPQELPLHHDDAVYDILLCLHGHRDIKTHYYDIHSLKNHEEFRRLTNQLSRKAFRDKSNGVIEILERLFAKKSPILVHSDGELTFNQDFMMFCNLKGNDADAQKALDEFLVFMKSVEPSHSFNLRRGDMIIAGPDQVHLRSATEQMNTGKNHRTFVAWLMGDKPCQQYDSVYLEKCKQRYQSRERDDF